MTSRVKRVSNGIKYDVECSSNQGRAALNRTFFR